MNRNQKIAIGCGGGGCLGIVVVIVAAGLLYYLNSSSTNSNYNFNSNYNRNSNFNSNYNRNSNYNSSSSSSSSMTDDEKHMLYQAAGSTKDSALMQQVMRKLDLMDSDNHQTFIKEHFAWAVKNYEFIQSINTPEKARAYVDAHIDD